MIRRPPRSTLFPTRRSSDLPGGEDDQEGEQQKGDRQLFLSANHRRGQDRKSTRLNSSHLVNSYAVFCLKKKKKNIIIRTTSLPTIDHRTLATTERNHTINST